MSRIPTSLPAGRRFLSPGSGRVRLWPRHRRAPPDSQWRGCNARLPVTRTCPTDRSTVQRTSLQHPSSRTVARSQAGYTLIELLICVAIVGLLASMAIGTYIDLLFKLKIDRAIWDIRTLEKAIALHSEHTLPSDLYELGLPSLIDPWGNEYRYLPIEGASRGRVRKDRFLVPINSDYDLYSMGPDGKSRPPLTAQASRDDIIRAGSGAYVGPADDY